jgi:acetate kinase
MAEVLLVLNAGSSSLKFSLFKLDDDGAPRLEVRGQIEGVGRSPRLLASDAAGVSLVDETLPAAEAADHAAALGRLRAWLERRLAGRRLVAAGHRVVHGGTRFAAPVRIDDQVLEQLTTLVPLAPLHQPHNLAAIRALCALDPDLPQIACFDTAFHRHHPRQADLFALPLELWEEGIRRYGFHGLSYEWVAGRLTEVAPDVAAGRVIVAHLGSGASLCALQGGRSVESTMGFTALDGIPMGTRPGALDAGVILHLIQERGLGVEQVADLLYHRSGLQGLSGISSDMRELLASPEPRAALAIDHFVYRICQTIGALAATLGGLDGIVFTAGIGERSPEIRARVALGCRWLGLELDEQANATGGSRISTVASRVAAFVIATDEERVIANHTLALLSSGEA